MVEKLTKVGDGELSLVRRVLLRPLRGLVKSIGP